MLEPLRCPSCSTRFGLSASRVHPGIRRAQCFRCDAVFGIEEVVARILGPVVPELPEEAPPSLTLGDLDGAEEEIMEKTLVTIPPPPAETEEPAAAEESPYGNGANFSSARDAIAKLMGTTPSVQPTQPRSMGSRGSMDVEATLNALDTTLGGAPAPSPAAAPTEMASTVRLSASEIQAALSSIPLPPRPLPPPPPPPRMEPPPRSENPSATSPSASQDPNLLKIQLETETCNNVTLEQMTSWIEQGRVHEYHMVARQFSDHWIEASKVPALRPVFEQRKRGYQPNPEDLPIPPAEILPTKKSLFGGFFGKN